MLAAKIGRDIFSTSDNAGKCEAGFWISGDVISDRLGGFVIANYDGTKGGFATVFEGKIAYKTNETTEKTKQNKTSNGGINRHHADWEKVEVEEEVDGNDGHHTDERGKKEAGDLSPAATTEKDGFFVKAEAGENNDVNRD